MPTAQIDQLLESLSTLESSDPKEASGLQCFAIRWKGSKAVDYMTLDEALETNSIEITEVSTGGSVPDLLVKNNSPRPIFVMAGEELIGAKQNRIINVSIMVPAEQELPIPVSCVEQGRWSYLSRHLKSSGYSSHSKLRSMVHDSATLAYKVGGTPKSDQLGVWSEVSRKMLAMKSPSASQALHQVFEDHEKLLKEIEDRFSAPDDAYGVVFAIGDRIVGGDLFDSPETLVKLWPKLIRSYAIDALEEPQDSSKTVDRQAIADWLRRLQEAKTEQFQSPGTGEDVRLTADNLKGAALLVDGKPVHVEFFAEQANEPQSPSPS